MASMAGTSGNPEKERLEAAMYLSHVFEEVGKECDSIVFTIRYYMLKHDVLYKYIIDEVKWLLSLTRKKRCVKIVLLADDLESDVTCSVVCDDKEVLTSITAYQISKGEYEIELSSSAIEDPRNKPLKEGRLVLQFKFNQKPAVVKCVRPCTSVRRYESDKLKLVKDLKAVCISSRFTNFVIKVNGKEINVPKALLAARSKYFEECVEDKDSCEMLKADHKAVYRAIHYMYTGELPIFSEFKEIIHLLEVAECLKMPSLQSQCALLACHFFCNNEVQIIDGSKEANCVVI